MAALPSDKKLKIATIFSYAVNEEIDGILDDENPENTDKLDQTSRDFWRVLLTTITKCLQPTSTLQVMGFKDIM